MNSCGGFRHPEIRFASWRPRPDRSERSDAIFRRGAPIADCAASNRCRDIAGKAVECGANLSIARSRFGTRARFPRLPNRKPAPRRFREFVSQKSPQGGSHAQEIHGRRGRERTGADQRARAVDRPVQHADADRRKSRPDVDHAPDSGAPTTPSAGNAQFVTKQSPDQWLASKFKGTDVIGADDKKIGDVSDILFDKDKKILAYIVGVGGFLGIGAKDVAIDPASFQACPARTRRLEAPAVDDQGRAEERAGVRALPAAASGEQPGSADPPDGRAGPDDAPPISSKRRRSHRRSTNWRLRSFWIGAAFFSTPSRHCWLGLSFARHCLPGGGRHAVSINREPPAIPEIPVRQPAPCRQRPPSRKAPAPARNSPIRSCGRRCKTETLIKSPKEAINVFDFEPVMRENVPPAHFGYMASGIDDEVTLRANREGFLKFQLRPRRLVDVSKVDMSTDMLGVKYDTPIIVAPVGGQQSFHADGEIAVAKAAKSRQSSADPLDLDQHRRRGGHRRARRADLVPALRHQQVGCRQGDGAARREGRLPRGRRHGRPQRRTQSGNAVPPAADRHARLQRAATTAAASRPTSSAARCIRDSTFPA